MLVAALDKAGGVPTTVVWRALPVHPKTVVLFLRGMPACEALVQAFVWYQFMLGTTMEDAANPAVSTIQTMWRRKDPGESDAFKTWY
jgi:hypothetical protein